MRNLARWTLALALALTALGLLLTQAPAFLSAPARQASSARPRPLQGVSGAAALQRLRALPASAQAVISRTFGAGQASFHASPTARGYRLAAGGLAAELTRAGVSLHAGARSAAGPGHDSLAMTLAAVGHGAQLQRVGSTLPHARANRVTYDDGQGVQSWYASGPLGIEQGFALAHRPGGSGGTLTLALDLSGQLQPRLIDAGQGLLFSGSGGRLSLRYGGLTVRDARGRELPASLALSHGRLLIHVADRRATYPLHVDPLLQAAKLTASGAVENDLLGYSVALSGTTVFVGTPWAKVGANERQGAVYVFTQPGGGWSNETQAAKLTASDGAPFADLGESVAVAGTTVFAGAPHATVAANEQQGAVYVFTKPGGGWSNETQAAKLTASDGAKTERLGTSVAASGTTVVAGAPQAKIGSAEMQGAAYVFTEPGGGWSNETEAAKLTASDGATNADLGESVAVSGTTVVAGAAGAQIGANETEGAAYVFTEPGGGWSNETQAAKLTASDGAANAALGFGVAVSGNTVLAGAPQAKVGSNKNQGAAYVFTEPGGGWSDETQAAKLTAAGGGGGAYLGVSLALSGTTAIVGAPDADLAPAGFKGAAYVFTEPGGGWSGERHQAEVLSAAEPSSYGFGWSVAVAGSTVVAGAPFFSEGAGEQSAAYVFSGEPASPSPQWFANGQLVGLGQKLAVATSASLTFTLTGQAGEPTIKCKLSDSETIENPRNAGAGVDEVTAFALTGCKTSKTLCPSKQMQFSPSGLPWHTHLVSGSPPSDTIEGVALTGSCTGEPHEVLRLEGTLTPTVGTSVLDFSASTGDLTGNFGPAMVTAADKLKGPKGASKITVEEG